MTIRKHTEKTAPRNLHRSEIFSLVGPLFLWMILFLALPLIYVVVISFLEKGTYGGVHERLGHTITARSDENGTEMRIDMRPKGVDTRE